MARMSDPICERTSFSSLSYSVECGKMVSMGTP